MSFHKSELAKLEAAGGAAWRKYQRLMVEAQGAQHHSPAEVAKVMFEHAWINDPHAVELAAQGEESGELEYGERRMPAGGEAAGLEVTHGAQPKLEPGERFFTPKEEQAADKKAGVKRK